MVKISIWLKFFLRFRNGEFGKFDGVKLSRVEQLIMDFYIVMVCKLGFVWCWYIYIKMEREGIRKREGRFQYLSEE